MPYRLATRWPEGGLGVAVTRVRPFKVQGLKFEVCSSGLALHAPAPGRGRARTKFLHQSGSGGRPDNPGGVDWLESFVGSAGEFGREHQFAVYHGLGKGWRLASPRLPPLPGGRAGPLWEFPVAKRVKSGASKSANSGNLLKPGEPGRTGRAVVLGHHQGDLWEVSPHPVRVSSDEL